MNDIKDILRQRHDLDLTRDQIAAATGVSAGTVSHVLERAAAAGLSWPLPDDLDDQALRARLYSPYERDSGHAQPDWEAVVEELTAPRKRRRARLTWRQLRVEYRDEVRARGGTAYSYSQFCARLKARLKDRAGETEMRFDYAPGLWGLSDFSGKTLALRTGRGEKDVDIFVAALAHSQGLGRDPEAALSAERAAGGSTARARMTRGTSKVADVMRRTRVWFAFSSCRKLPGLLDCMP